MKAIDYLNSFNSCLKYKDEVKRIIEEMHPIKYDEKATSDYYERILTPDLRYEKDGIDFVSESGEINRFIAAEIRLELFKTVEEDKSFSYLFCLLAQEQNRINEENKVNLLWIQRKFILENIDKAQTVIDHLNGINEENKVDKSNPIDCIPLPYADNDMDFYYNTKNIPNTTLVPETIQYFKEGDGKGFFEPLDFLNLLWIQRKFILENIDKAQTVIDHLNGLHLDEKKRHILLCFIIKWAGGYPISNLNRQFKVTYSLIVKEFLKYPENTPEKEFCHNRWHNNLAISGDIATEEDWQEIQIDMMKKELKEKDAEIANLKTANNQNDTTSKDAEIATANNQSDTTSMGGTRKVKTVVLLQILEKIGAKKSNTDLAKLTRLIAYLIEKSPDKIYEIARQGITFTEHHSDEIDKANKLLGDINISISIDKNKQY
ncbi:MAG: hypothetical protein LBE13_07440 [Bacteroidales bacterium]|jgi:hypothetical protein|nr:hypothetical protein [Bacteroidales bacterium]